MQRKPEGVETIAQRSLSPTAQNCLMSPSEGNGSAVQSFPARRQSAFTMFPPATLELKTHGVPSVPTGRMSGNALSGRSTCDQTPLVQFTTTLLPVSAIAHRLSFVPRGAVVRAGAPVTNSQLPSEVYSCLNPELIIGSDGPCLCGTGCGYCLYSSSDAIKVPARL